jgi:HK97 family phage major capsid protein
MVEESAVLNASPRIINTSTGESLKVPTFTSYSTAAIVAEGSAIPESDPDTETVTLGAYHFAVLRDVSNQLLTDTDFDLGLYLGEEMGRAIGQAIGSYIDSANAGTSAPQGVFGTATTTGVTGTAANYVPTTNELVGLYYSVGERYRGNGSWVMSSNTAKTLANLVDTTGRSLLLPNLSGDAVGTIMGRPVYTSPNVPAAGSAVASIAFGDFSRFIAVRYAGGMRIDLSRDFRFSQDLTSYRASMRFDSKILDASAVKKFVGKDG